MIKINTETCIICHKEFNLADIIDIEVVDHLLDSNSNEYVDLVLKFCKPCLENIYQNHSFEYCEHCDNWTNEMQSVQTERITWDHPGAWEDYCKSCIEG